MQLEYGETTGLAFTSFEKIYKPILKAAKPTLVDAPEDLVGWFQNNPYLKTEDPKPTTVGGVKGQQFDMVAEVPEDHASMCGTDCVDAIKYTGSQVVFFEGDKIHAIVLEDVKGEAVYLDYGGLAKDFDKVAPEGQKVVNRLVGAPRYIHPITEKISSATFACPVFSEVAPALATPHT